VCVDRRLAQSARTVADVLVSEWPRLASRVTLMERDLSDADVGPNDVVVSAHACGPLTDAILAKAVAATARVVVLPCCHAKSKCDTGHLDGWLDPALAIDVTRAARLTASGYRVHTQRIPATITPKNRLLFGEPLNARSNADRIPP
jgi:hypothetical protein